MAEIKDSIETLRARMKTRIAHIETLRAEAEARAARTPAQMFLPGLEETLRAMPNHIARSSLFAPIARGKRKQHNETPLVTRADATITYTGEQLDEADADLTLQLVHDARSVALGKPVTINRAATLRAIGRRTNGTEYEWLHRRIKALTAATLFITASKNGKEKYSVGRTTGFHVVQSFEYDEQSETYTYTLDPRWIVLFRNREFALIDWDKRMTIGRGQDMAKCLQRLISTSDATAQRFALDGLKLQMQYTGRMRDFRTALTRAITELCKAQIITRGAIGKSTAGKEQLTLWIGG
jgi:hypothetical protein